MGEICTHEHMHGHRRREVREQKADRPYGTEAHDCPEHRVTDGSRRSGTDVDTVPGKGRTARNRHEQKPGKILAGCGDNRLVRGHHPEHRHSCKMIYHHEYQRNTHTPYKYPLHCLTDHHTVLRSDVLSCESLAGIGESVSEV